MADAAPFNNISPVRTLPPDIVDSEKTPTSLYSRRASWDMKRSSSAAPKPSLSPSPAFRESRTRLAQDDTALNLPSTPKRFTPHTRGLSLQMPPKEAPNTPSGFAIPRGPLSPKPEASYAFSSPTSMLPRRSRGLEFTRACTGLYQSTLAASSPDASPTIGGKGIQIPKRRSMGNSVLDSPSNVSNGLWSSMPSLDRPGLSSSVSSVNMLDSDSDSDSDFEDMAVDADTDDPMLNTPAAIKLHSNLISRIMSSPGGDSLAGYRSPGRSNFPNFTRLRGSGKKSRHSSSSASLRSAKPSPGPLSPHVVQSIEATNANYFSPGLTRRQVQSRRESLSLGTDMLHLSDSEDNEQRNVKARAATMDVFGESPRGVVRRAVNRRSNMLPKSKGFARIKAALLEESTPVDTDLRREAEVIRQVQENDDSDPSPIFPATPFATEPETSTDEDLSSTQHSLPMNNFGQHAQQNSAGLGFWHDFENNRYRTPPPSLVPRESSSTLSEDTMDTPGASNVFPSIENAALMHFNRSRSRSRSTTPMPQNGLSAGEVARRVNGNNNKRRREEDFDPAAIKRRAVSPGLSVQSSPILPQSPALVNDKSWGHPPPKQQDRSNSGGSVSNGTKKVGIQGMTDTNDGIMNMSID